MRPREPKRCAPRERTAARPHKLLFQFVFLAGLQRSFAVENVGARSNTKTSGQSVS